MKWISLLTCCFLLVGLVGCSGGTENSIEPSQDTESQDEEKVIEEDESQSGKGSEEASEEIPEVSAEYGDTEDEPEQSTGEETNQTVEDQFDIISDQLVASGYAPLDEWHVEQYREEIIGYEGKYDSAFIGENATLSILDDGDQIICVSVAVPSDEENAYEELCSVFGACTWNIFFTKDELEQIHDQLENAPTNTDVYIDEHSVNYSEGIDILILGGG